METLPDWSWDPHADQWEEGFFHLKQFSDREKHCRVSATDQTDTGYRLGQWVAVQRGTKDALEPDRRRRSEALPGWSWDALSDKWEQGFFHLKEFSKRAGHCRMLAKYKTGNGFGLGIWVNKQREKKDTIEPDRRQRLEALPGWTWAPHSDKWEKGFSHLKEFSERENHCRVAALYKTNDGHRLGQWTQVQRQTKDTMEPDRRRRLETLPGWSWDVLSDQWEEGYFHLKVFSEREGHCRVPQGYESNGGYPLGRWASKQRAAKDKIDLGRRQRLEALPGWTWDVFLDQWEEGFSYLKEFSEREGRCRVPYGYKTEGGYRLGQWVTSQRSNRDTMEPARRQRLEALPGWSWDVLSDLWEEGFAHLTKFLEREHHCRVPKDYKNDAGHKLGHFWLFPISWPRVRFAS